VAVVFDKMGVIIGLVAPLIMKGGMPMHEIFKKLSNRMVGAMMIHTQLTELFNFIDLEPDAKRQKKQLHDESDGLLKLEKYAAQHHHILITSDNPPQVDILNLDILERPNDKLSPDDKIHLIQYALKEWIEWEKKSKVIYEDSYRSLVDMSEIATADFVLRYVKDVDKELRDAELLYRVRDAIDWDLATIYDKQARLSK
jgi:hypothetical protein